MLGTERRAGGIALIGRLGRRRRILCLTDNESPGEKVRELLKNTEVGTEKEL